MLYSKALIVILTQRFCVLDLRSVSLGLIVRLRRGSAITYKTLENGVFVLRNVCNSKGFWEFEGRSARINLSYSRGFHFSFYFTR